LQALDMTGNKVVMELTRREALAAGAGAIAGGVFVARPAWANPIMAIATELTNGRTPEASDRIRLIIPHAFKNGDAVPVTVEVEGPISEEQYVKNIHLLAEANPLPEVASFHLTPRSGRARILTRIRLAQPQNVMAIAEMADGSVFMTTAYVEVDTNGCT
jgi:sulfur-oxidizing protein SoxY